jgi:tetratricopeptide (TPR) repeat protein
VTALCCLTVPRTVARIRCGRTTRAMMLSWTVLLAVGGCTHWPRRGPVAQDVIISRQLSQQGMDALHSGSLLQAEDRFIRAIEHCPTNRTARYQLANCLWKREARQEAIDQLARAIELDGFEDVEMMVELGYMWANVGNLDEALAMAERSIRAAPDHALAWRLRGDVLRERQDWAAALASYHRSLTYDATNAEVQLSVAEVYHHMDRPARVLATLHHLDGQLPPDGQPERMLVLRSLACQQLERYDEAVQVLTRAQPGRRLTTGALLQLAHAQAAAGRFAEAQQTIQRALPEADASEQATLRQLMANMAQLRVPDDDTTRR